MSIAKREAAEPESHDDLMRFLSIFWDRKLFVVLGVVLGLLVGTLYYVKAKPVFQSSTRLLISKKGPDVLPVPGADPRVSYYDDYVGVQQVLIRSPEVLGRLVKKEEFKALSFSKNSEQKAIDQISANLTVLRGADKEKEGGTSAAMMGAGGTNVLTFVFRHTNPDDCTQVVRLLLETYKEYLEENYTDVGKKTLQLIDAAQKTQEKLLTKKREERIKFVSENPTVLMSASKNKDGFAGVSDRYGLYQDVRANIFLRQLEIISHLQSLQKAEASHTDPAIMKDMIRRFDKLVTDPNNRLTAPEINLDSLRIELVIKQAQLVAKFGKDNQEVQITRANLKEVEKLIAQRDSGLDTGPALLKSHRSLLGQELDDIKIRDKNLETLMTEEKERAGKTIADQIKLANMDADIHTTEDLLQGIVVQLQKLELLQGAGGYQASVLNHPSLAVQVEPRFFLTYSLAAVAGLILGLGLAYLTDLTDRSFRTPVDISRSLKLAVVGHVPVLTGKVPAGQESKLSPFLCTHFRPKSRDAEAFREIRTALYFNTRNTNCRKLQITSAASGDGKSTMASNLAISIAQSGKRVLLVDCDLRRPRIHTLFGLSNEAGFSTVLTENAEPSDVTAADVVPGLSVIPAGPGLPNPAEILTSARFHECANLLTEKYDFVLFDTPPLLAVTDPAVIAPRMDGVFLVVRLGKRERNMAERSAEILRTLEANVIGVVVNAIGQDGMGYGRYGRYYYGRYSYYYGAGGYRYGKGYTYGNDGYYVDEDRQDRNLVAPPASNGHKSPMNASIAAEEGPNGEEPVQAGSIKRAFRWFLGD